MHEVKLSSVDLNLLVVFDTIMAEGSVSRAAERLHLTQSAVSHALARFRVIVDDPLFIRTPRGMEPTVYAEAIAPRVAMVLEDIRGILAPDDRFDPARSERRFTIGMTDYIAWLIMPTLIRRLEQAAPGVRIVLLPSNARNSLGQIERGDIEIYVGFVPTDPPNFVGCADLYLDSSVCVGRKGHPAFAQPMTQETFLSLSHLHISPWGEPGFIDEMLARQQVSRHIALTVGAFLVAPAIVEQSDLVAIMPTWFAIPMTSRYALEICAPPYDLGAPKIGLTWHRRYDTDPGLNWLRDEIAAVVAHVTVTGEVMTGEQFQRPVTI